MRLPWRNSPPNSTDAATNPPTSPPTEVRNTVRWWSTTDDTDLALILASAKERALRSDPDVCISPHALPPEFREIVALILQRMRSLQDDAQRAAATLVERVLTFHTTRSTSDDSTQDDSEESEASRRAAARAAEAIHKIGSMTDALRLDLEQQEEYAKQALQQLDRTFRHHHRFAKWLEYKVPDLEVPDDIYNIGLERLPKSNGASEGKERSHAGKF